MKTLDEVIDAMERCSIPHYFDCKGCPYEDDDAEVGCRSDDRDADVLNYLKEYKGLSKMWNDKLDKEQTNPALTMKEFSRMIDTEPIWCQELQEWYLFLAYDDGDNRIQLMTDKGDIETFDESDLEKYPLYRRK